MKKVDTDLDRLMWGMVGLAAVAVFIRLIVWGITNLVERLMP